MKIVEQSTIDTPNTQKGDQSMSCLGSDTSIKCDWVKPFCVPKPPLFVIGSGHACVPPHVSIM